MSELVVPGGEIAGRLDPALLAPYVAGLVRRRIGAGRGALVDPEREQLQGAVLFADISGFTALAEHLGGRGPAGAEALTDLLNGCFGELISLVAAHGGDVVKFAGDGLLALFVDDEPGAAAGRAGRCALLMQEGLRAHALGSPGRLSMRIGVGAGQVTAAHLGGGQGRWELLVTGPAITQATAAEQRAAPGDVLLSGAAAALLLDRCEGDQWPGGEGNGQGHVRLRALRPAPTDRAAEPRLPEADEAPLRGYVPPAVLARLDAGQSDWLSEHRRISVSFVMAPGLEDTDGPCLERAHRAVRAVQDVVGRYGGTLDKLGVDDKGATFLVVFGLPPLAHDDDAARALDAALALRGVLRAGGLGCSIGVASGRAFCGVVGSRLRHEYTVIGDVVNRAARLMQHARDDVLCDGATQRAARARVAFETLPPVRVKGRVEPVEVFRPRGRTRADGPGHQLLGRAAERAALDQRLAALREGRGAVVLVEGEAGIGKSRLLLDLVARARARGLRVVTGAADAVERATPYLAWRTVVEGLLGPSLDAPLRRERLLERLRGRPDLAALAPLLNDVVALGIPANEITEQMHGQVRADNTRALLVGLLEQAAVEAPLVVVLEDAHWLDSASWAVAWLAGQRVRNVLLVLAMRPLDGQAPAAYQHLVRAAGGGRLTLDGLAADEVVALVCQRLAVASIPDRVAELILEHGEGNPLFTQELAYALRDSGTVVVTDGECRLAPDADLDALSLPETVEGVVTSRIDRLTPPQQLVLKVASVVDHVFGYRIVRDIHPLRADVPALPANLDALERLDFTVLDTPAPERAWSFKHAIIQDVSYNLMLFAQRRELHRAAAQWYERNHEDQLDGFYPLLAHHWRRAEVADKAVKYQGLSGEQALLRGSYKEATLFLTEALSGVAGAQRGRSDRLRQARWERQLAEAHLGLGQTDRGQAHLMAALGALGRAAPAPASKPMIGAGLARQLPIQLVHRLLPAWSTGRGQGRAAELLEAARAYIRLVEVYWFANDTAALVHAGLRALNLAEKAAPSAELARAYAIVCLSAGSIPIHRLARAYARRAIETAYAVKQLEPLGYARFITSVYAIGTGAWREIEASLAEAAAICERLGDRRMLGDTRTVQAMSSLYQGDFAAAGRTFRDVHAVGADNDNLQHQVWGLIGMGECELRDGRPKEAGERLEAALALLRDAPDPAEQLRAHGLLAVARLRAGDGQGARRSAQAAAELIGQLWAPTAHYLLEGYAGVAEVWLSLWASGDRSAEVRQAARRACVSLRRFARVFAIGEPRSLLWTGRYHQLAGRPAKARASWEKSLAAARGLGMRFEQALARSALAGTLGQEALRTTCSARREEDSY